MNEEQVNKAVKTAITGKQCFNGLEEKLASLVAQATVQVTRQMGSQVNNFGAPSTKFELDSIRVAKIPGGAKTHLLPCGHASACSLVMPKSDTSLTLTFEQW